LREENGVFARPRKLQCMEISIVLHPTTTILFPYRTLPLLTAETAAAAAAADTDTDTAADTAGTAAAGTADTNNNGNGNCNGNATLPITFADC